MKFEWDDDKYEENIRKHGIPFEYAALIFDDENRIEDYDDEHSDSEDRYDIIGMVDKVLFVVVTYRNDEENLVRIISAREATKEERRRYEWQWSGKPWKKLGEK